MPPATDLTPVTARGEATRRKLLAAAEHEFGRKGYHAASISSITDLADVGQGTFYLYFHGKDDVFGELVRHMGRELRDTLSAAIEGVRPRLQAERLGLEAFLRYVADHQDLYRIVQESHFVDEAAYRAYYQDIAEAYAKQLAEAEERGEIRPGSAEGRAWALMGLGHFLGMRYCLWTDDGPPAQVMDGVLDFIAHGMAPDDRPQGTTE